MQVDSRDSKSLLNTVKHEAIELSSEEDISDAEELSSVPTPTAEFVRSLVPKYERTARNEEGRKTSLLARVLDRKAGSAFIQYAHFAWCALQGLTTGEWLLPRPSAVRAWLDEQDVRIIREKDAQRVHKMLDTLSMLASCVGRGAPIERKGYAPVHPAFYSTPDRVGLAPVEFAFLACILHEYGRQGTNTVLKLIANTHIETYNEHDGNLRFKQDVWDTMTHYISPDEIAAREARLRNNSAEEKTEAEEEFKVKVEPGIKSEAMQAAVEASPLREVSPVREVVTAIGESPARKRTSLPADAADEPPTKKQRRERTCVTCRKPGSQCRGAYKRQLCTSYVEPATAPFVRGETTASSSLSDSSRSPAMTDELPTRNSPETMELDAAPAPRLDKGKARERQLSNPRHGVGGSEPAQPFTRRPMPRPKQPEQSDEEPRSAPKRSRRIIADSSDSEEENRRPPTKLAAVVQTSVAQEVGKSKLNASASKSASPAKKVSPAQKPTPAKRPVGDVIDLTEVSEAVKRPRNLQFDRSGFFEVRANDLRTVPTGIRGAQRNEAATSLAEGHIVDLDDSSDDMEEGEVRENTPPKTSNAPVPSSQPRNSTQEASRPHSRTTAQRRGSTDNTQRRASLDDSETPAEKVARRRAGSRNQLTRLLDKVYEKGNPVPARLTGEDVEQALFDLLAQPDPETGELAPRHEYGERFRFLYTNLKSSDVLRIMLIKGSKDAEVDAAWLVKLTAEDLKTEEQKKAARKAEAESLRNSVRADLARPKAKLTHKGEIPLESRAGSVAPSRAGSPRPLPAVDGEAVTFRLKSGSTAATMPPPPTRRASEGSSRDMATSVPANVNSLLRKSASASILKPPSLFTNYKGPRKAPTAARPQAAVPTSAFLLAVRQTSPPAHELEPPGWPTEACFRKLYLGVCSHPAEHYKVHEWVKGAVTWDCAVALGAAGLEIPEGSLKLWPMEVVDEDDASSKELVDEPSRKRRVQFQTQEPVVAVATDPPPRFMPAAPKPLYTPHIPTPFMAPAGSYARPPWTQPEGNYSFGALSPAIMPLGSAPASVIPPREFERADWPPAPVAGPSGPEPFSALSGLGKIRRASNDSRPVFNAKVTPPVPQTRRGRMPPYICPVSPVYRGRELSPRSTTTVADDETDDEEASEASGIDERGSETSEEFPEIPNDWPNEVCWHWFKTTLRKNGKARFGKLRCASGKACRFAHRIEASVYKRPQLEGIFWRHEHAKKQSSGIRSSKRRKPSSEESKQKAIARRRLKRQIKIQVEEAAAAAA